jgi:hypothetical protein
MGKLSRRLSGGQEDMFYLLKFEGEKELCLIALGEIATAKEVSSGSSQVLYWSNGGLECV